MTIDAVDISNFGLSVLTVKDYLNFPQRKDVLNEPEFTDNDLKLKPWDFTIELGGRWNNLTGMQADLNSLQTQLKSTVKHTIVIPEKSIPATADIVFKNGYQVNSMESNGVMIAKITLKATVTNSKWIAN